MSVKRAAIKLKGIDAADRRWVLKRLNKRELSKLLPVLSELDEISYAQILDLEAVLDEECQQRAAGGTGQTAEQDSRRLDAFSETTIQTVLENTSDSFLSLLVGGQIDKSDSGILAYIGPSRRQSIAVMADRRKHQLARTEISQVEEFLIQKLQRVEYGRDL